MFKFIRAVLLFFIAMTPTLFATAEVLSDYESAKTEASELLKEGRALEAYEAYMRLLRENPLDGEINLGVARSAYEAGRYNQAIMAYERLIESYPDKSFLRLELARVYLALKNADNARETLNMAKAIDPTLQSVELDAIIKIMENDRKKWFFTGNLNAGLGYDSNANSGPYSSKIVLGNIPLSLAKDSVRAPSMAGSLSANFNLIYRKNPKSRLLFVSDASLYGKAYSESRVAYNDLFWGRLAAGLRYNWDKTYLDARIKGDFAQYPRDKNIGTTGVELINGVILPYSLTLINAAAYEQRFYKGSPNNDGFMYYLNESLRWSFLGSNTLIFGLRFAQRQAQSDMFSYLAGEAYLRGFFALPGDIVAAPHVSYREEWYKGPGTALERDLRLDGQTRAGVSFTKYFANNMSVELAYQYINNASSSPIYKYEQHTVTATVSYNF